jgi:ubiquinone/menaquinone biosynthesis C-methylase UbiE
MNENELKVSEAFSRQSVIFDELNNNNKISEYLRSIYRAEVDSKLRPNDRILELNCGTGLDAIYFASKGHDVLATDLSQGMINQLNAKLTNADLKGKIRTMLCSFNELSKIKDQKFDYILSNFGGLNCTDKLNEVLISFNSLLNNNGKISLVIMPKYCPWEWLMVLKGKFSTAFRRFRKGTSAHIEGKHFLCYYYSPDYILNALKKDFKLLSLKGICITVPPEFYTGFIERYPKLFKFLSKIDKSISKVFPFTHCCDHYVITLQKKSL